MLRIKPSRLTMLRRVKRVNIVIISSVLAFVLAIGPIVHYTIAASCITPLGPNDAARASAVSDAYQQWKANYVTAEGANGNLRVHRSSMDNYDSVSEGIAYGMIFAAYNHDKPTLDGLWAYEQQHVDANGLMNWKIAADGSTIGANGATDADEDMALALVAADTIWGSYTAAANQQINAIQRTELEPGTAVVKPGDMFGGSALLNPSYLSPAYYGVFAKVTGDQTWTKAEAASYSVLKAAQNDQTGLVPDWSTSRGAPSGNMGYNYSYDATRMPLRTAMAASWSCQPDAVSLLSPINTWFSRQDVAHLSDTYTTNGQAIGSGDATPVLASATAAAITSNDSAYRAKMWSTLTGTSSATYYPDSLRLFSMMIASGILVNPLELDAHQPVAASAPTDTIKPTEPALSQPTSPSDTSATTVPEIATTANIFEVSGHDQTGVVAKSTQLQVSYSAATYQPDMNVDLEIHNAAGDLVAQQVYEHQAVTKTAMPFSIKWTPEHAGAYTLKAGVFSGDWKQLTGWNDQAAKIVVDTPPISIRHAPQSSGSLQAGLPAQTAASLQGGSATDITVWWPGSSRPISGTQPFKARIDGIDQSSYTMDWQVDGGVLNEMHTAYGGVAYKEADVDVSDWNWSADKRYTITFVAKNASGKIIATTSRVIML